MSTLQSLVVYNYTQEHPTEQHILQIMMQNPYKLLQLIKNALVAIEY